jgi:hypothetical protein
LFVFVQIFSREKLAKDCLPLHQVPTLNPSITSKSSIDQSNFFSSNFTFLLIQNHENLQQLRNEKLNSKIIQKIKERVGKKNQLAILKSLKFATAGKFHKKAEKNERIILLEFFSTLKTLDINFKFSTEKLVKF